MTILFILFRLFPVDDKAKWLKSSWPQALQAPFQPAGAVSRLRAPGLRWAVSLPIEDGRLGAMEIGVTGYEASPPACPPSRCASSPSLRSIRAACGMLTLPAAAA